MAAGDIAVARTVAALRERVPGWRKQQERSALVPTMGALHRGHLTLVEAARRYCERVVASLFVNPKQFGPREDFTAYPRDEAADLAKFREAGVDLVFAPTVEEMYPAGFVTAVRVAGIGDELEGAHRPTVSQPSSRSSCCSACRISRISARRTISSCWWCAAWRGSSTSR